MKRKNLDSFQSEEEVMQLRAEVDTEGKQGFLFFSGKQYSEAIKIYNQAIAKLNSIQQKKDDDKRKIAIFHKNISGSYYMQNKFQESIFSHQESINIFKSIEQQTDDDKRKIASFYGNIAMIYDKQNKFQESIFSYQESINIYKSIEQQTDDDKIGIVFGHDNIAREYYKQNQFQQTIFSYQEAIALFEEITEENVRNLSLPKIHLTIKNLANTYSLAIHNKISINVEEAKKALQRAINVCFGEAKSHYAEIAKWHDDLNRLSLNFSLEFSLFSFAYQVFSQNVPGFFFGIEYQKILSDVLNESILPTPKIHHQLLQILECVEKNVDSPDFPNQAVKIYLSNEANMKQFKGHIQELKKIIEAPTLLATASQSTNLMVNMVMQFNVMKEELNSLKEENKQLKYKIEQLHAQNTSQSAYSTNLTLFPSASSASSGAESNFSIPSGSKHFSS